MGVEQRWAASGVVVLLGALWGLVGGWTVSEPYRWDPPGDDMTGGYVFLVGVLILGLTALWLVAGLTTVARVSAGRWRWRPAALLWGGAALLSLLAAGAAWSAGDAVATALFGFQAFALTGYVALLWTPSGPVSAPGTPGP